MLSENDGSMRRAFNEPSRGSITTVAPEFAAPKRTSPRSSEIAVNSRPSSFSRSSSAKTMSSLRRSMASVWSPPSPTPS